MRRRASTAAGTRASLGRPVRSDTERRDGRRTVFCVLVRLHNGVEVLIRPIRPDDKGLLAAGMDHLSEQSTYQRFLAPKRRLTAAELRYLTEVDFRDHVALVAVRPEAPDVLVGVGRWIRLPHEPEVAEIAFVVADDLQRRGLGTALAEALADVARERGVRRFVATMLPHNLAAHHVFARVAQEREVTTNGTVHELSGDVRPARPRAARPPRSARALR
jgi:RimJ/RimL family protein N-acetyltransferase